MQLILQKRKQWTTTVTCGVENHCQAFFLSIWVNVEPSIDALKSKNGTLRIWLWLTLFWKCWHADWIMGDTRNNCEYIPRGMLRIYFETKRLQVKSLYKFPIELRCFFLVYNQTDKEVQILTFLFLLTPTCIFGLLTWTRSAPSTSRCFL